MSQVLETIPFTAVRTDTLVLPKLYWTPTQLMTALLAWFKADAGVVFSSGTVVAQWNDQSGNGLNIAAKSGVAAVNLITNALNGLPQMEPTTGGYLGSALTTPFSSLNFAGTQPFSIAGVFTYKTTSTGQAYLIAQQNPSSPYQGWAVDTGTNAGNHLSFRLMANVAGPIYAVIVRGSTALVNNTSYSFVMTYNGSGVAAGVTIYIGGVAETPTVIDDTLGMNSTVQGSTGASMGALGANASSNASPSFLSEFFLVNRVMTSAEIASYAGYTLGRWGV